MTSCHDGSCCLELPDGIWINTEDVSSLRRDLVEQFSPLGWSDQDIDTMVQAHVDLASFPNPSPEEIVQSWKRELEEGFKLVLDMMENIIQAVEDIEKERRLRAEDPDGLWT